jgi:hypothetical protein
VPRQDGAGTLGTPESVVPEVEKAPAPYTEKETPVQPQPDNTVRNEQPLAPEPFVAEPTIPDRPNLGAPSYPDTIPNIDTTIPMPTHTLVLEAGPGADTVSEQILSEWKAGKLNHLGWVPEPGTITTREFLERMWNAVDQMDATDLKAMHIESGDFTKMPVGDEYDAVPLLEKMFGTERTSASENTVLPQSESTVETSPRPLERPDTLNSDSNPDTEAEPKKYKKIQVPDGEIYA